MCGIAGIWNFRSGRPVEEPDLRAMTDRMVHRGPDDEGFWRDGPIGLGFRRLSIIDLAGGHQPLSNEDGSVWLVFNGEIYNFQELRHDLLARGHSFRTASDSEVIVHAYEEWGLECLTRLDGMFGIALWDAKRNRLLLARDRMGKKPLVYAHTRDGIVFASEIGALLARPEVGRDVNLDALSAYLTLQYVPHPQTIFAEMHKLPAAHYRLIDEDGETLEPYWSMRFQPDETLTEREAIPLVRDTVKAAVARRLVSDVPLGAFLSGGIDSSIVVGLMAQLMDQPVRTFSIGFGVQSHNELPHAQTVARRFGTEHREFMVEPNMVDVLPKLAAHFGEPFADGSALATYYLAQQTRRHVTVALSGDGGDEMFAGYYRHIAGLQSALWDDAPLPIRQAGKWVADRVPDAVLRHRLAHRFAVVARHLTLPERYQSWVLWKSHVDWREVASPELLDALTANATYERVVQRWFDPALAPDPLGQMQLADAMTQLPDDILVKADITSMANSLEVRSPLLDRAVIELAERLPVNLRVRGSTGKWILREAFADLLPPDVAVRPKQGFEIPFDDWLRGDLRPMLHDLVLGSLSRRGYFQPAGLRRMVSEHERGVGNHAGLLWGLLMLELWQQSLLRGKASEAAA